MHGKAPLAGLNLRACSGNWCCFSIYFIFVIDINKWNNGPVVQGDVSQALVQEVRGSSPASCILFISYNSLADLVRITVQRLPWASNNQPVDPSCSQMYAQPWETMVRLQVNVTPNPAWSTRAACWAWKIQILTPFQQVNTGPFGYFFKFLFSSYFLFLF